MTTVAWVAIGILAAAVVLLAARLRSLQDRVVRAETRLHAIDDRLAAEITPELRLTRSEARAAGALARRAAGLDVPPEKVALEPVTGRLIRAVAWGAGARRALGTLARRDTAGRRAS